MVGKPDGLRGEAINMDFQSQRRSVETLADILDVSVCSGSFSLAERKKKHETFFRMVYERVFKKIGDNVKKFTKLKRSRTFYHGFFLCTSGSWLLEPKWGLESNKNNAKMM
jgi:hypothetical protein